MKRTSRLILLAAALFVAGWLPASKAYASGGTCQIWCDNGITVSGWSSSFSDCQSSFVANCSQWGWYGGQFCYSGEEGSGCYIW